MGALCVMQQSNTYHQPGHNPPGRNDEHEPGYGRMDYYENKRPGYDVNRSNNPYNNPYHRNYENEGNEYEGE